MHLGFYLQKGAINKQFQSILKIVPKYTSYNNFKNVQYTVYITIDTIDFRFFFKVPFLESTRDPYSFISKYIEVLFAFNTFMLSICICICRFFSLQDFISIIFMSYDSTHVVHCVFFSFIAC